MHGVAVLPEVRAIRSAAIQFFQTAVWESISVPDGVTANDADDSDTGANNLQNFPVLTSVTSSGNSTTIQGSLNSTPNTTFQIDFYSSAALDPSGNGEGALFFNTTSVTTDGNGDATINVTFPMALEAGRVVTATATDPMGTHRSFRQATLQRSRKFAVQCEFNSGDRRRWPRDSNCSAQGRQHG